MDAGVFLESSLFLFDMVTTVLSVTTPPLYSPPAALLGKLLLVILAGGGAPKYISIQTLRNPFLNKLE